MLKPANNQGSPIRIPRAVRRRTCNAGSSNMPCWIIALPALLQARILGKLELGDVPSARGTCKDLHDLDLADFLPSVLKSSLSEERRRELLVQKFCCMGETRWPQSVLPALVKTVGVNHRDRRTFGRTPLMSAAGNGNQSTVEALLALGADVNAADFIGRTALWHTTDAGSVRIAEILIAAGACLDVGDKMDGCTPLLAAFYNCRDDIAVTLIKAGADVNARDSEGKTALWFAMKRETEFREDRRPSQSLMDALMEADADLGAMED